MNSNKKNIFQSQYIGAIQKVQQKINQDFEKFPKDLKEVFPKFLIFLNQIEEIINLSIDYDVPDDIAELVENLYNHFHAYFNQIHEFEIDMKNGIALKGEELDKFIKKFVNIFLRDKEENFTSAPFFTLVGFLKSYKLNNLNDLEILKEQIQKKMDTVEKLDRQVRETAQQVITQNYAEIFEKQAKEHSFFRILPLKNLKIGKGNLWLIFGITSLFLGLFYLNCYSPSVMNSGSITAFENINFTSLSNRIIFILIWLGVIRFSFKQYSIHSHLYVTNTHRQNVLNSFKLLHDSLIDSNKESDRELQKLLAMEVARVIFQSGETGFVQSPEMDSQNPNIIELLKLIKDKSIK